MTKHVAASAQIRADFDAVAALMCDPVDVIGPRGETAGTYIRDIAVDLHEGGSVRQSVVVSIEPLEPDDRGFACRLSWRSTGRQRLLPGFDGRLAAEPDVGVGTVLHIEGTYRPPFGPVGAVVDAVSLHRFAAGSLLRFVQDLATAIDRTLDHRHARSRAAGPLPDDLRPLPSEHWLG